MDVPNSILKTALFNALWDYSSEYGSQDRMTRI